jgi:DNA-binding CsgD family transcriptional regulator
MKESRGLDRIREMSRLGLPGEMFVLAALRETGAVIPGAAAAFFWLDAAGRVVNCCAERLPPGNGRGASSSWTDDSSFTHSVLEANGARDIIPRDIGARGRPRARICVYRGEAGIPFGERDIAVIDEAVRYLAHGLEHQAAPDEASRCDALVVASEELLVCDGGGRVLHATEGSRTMLLLASGIPLSPSDLGRAEAASAALLAAMCAPPQRRGGASPSMRSTLWGTFSFRLHPLPNPGAAGAGLSAVQVRRHEPAQLRMLDALGTTALSARQREVALLISLGRSNAQIGQALCVSENTVSYHVKSLFARFDVHNRAGLTSRLVTAGAGAD